MTEEDLERLQTAIEKNEQNAWRIESGTEFTVQ